MAEENKTLEKRCAELERLLEEARKETEYYQRIAKSTGRRRLREIDQLSRLITARKRAENKLRESEKRYREVVRDMSAMVCRFLPDGTLTFVNSAYSNYFNKKQEELIGQNFFQFIPEEEQDKVRNHFMSLNQERAMITYEHHVIAPDGNLRWQRWSDRALFNEQGRLMEYQSLGIDITEEKLAQDEKAKLEAQLQQAQKMEAIGTLAGGIAHDFNNLLMGIQGYASLILLDIDSSHPHYDKLMGIKKQVQSGAKLTKQLLGYARKGRYEVKPVSLNKLVEETSEVFGRTKKEITIYRELGNDLFVVEADQGQIEQVLLNLYVNASDAMSTCADGAAGRPGGGDLVLKTMNTTHDNIKGGVYDPKPGNYVMLTVTDTGMGMDKKTMECIFDPFFTTKEMGRGTGLGLASVYGIIKAHGGYIDVKSKKGHGTTFSIYLPASEEKGRKTERTAEQFIKGTGAVLLVDDEEVILEVGKELLEVMGYRVLTAKDGKEAIEVYRKKGAEIDIVLLDMVMPNVSGGEAYDRMKEINPDVKVLLSSGYSVEGQATEILERGCDGFIQKPFDMEKLSGKIREILRSK